MSLGRRAVQHPTWVAEYARGRVRRRGGWEFSLAPYADIVADAQATVCEVFGVTARQYAEAAQSEWWPEFPDDPQAGRATMASIIRVVTRLARPRTSVETGVARGVTTAATLQAMEDNGLGHLYSVDLPPLSASPEYVGQLVPQRLRHRWTLRQGPSRKILPRLLAELGTIDVFLHDAEHSYMSQMEEFEAAWPRLSPGGVLLADDVRNPAIIDFAERVGAHLHIIGTPTDIDGVGLLRKAY